MRNNEITLYRCSLDDLFKPEESTIFASHDYLFTVSLTHDLSVQEFEALKSTPIQEVKARFVEIPMTDINFNFNMAYKLSAKAIAKRLLEISEIKWDSELLEYLAKIVNLSAQKLKIESAQIHVGQFQLFLGSLVYHKDEMPAFPELAKRLIHLYQKEVKTKIKSFPLRASDSHQVSF